jgi:hypothetical protein
MKENAKRTGKWLLVAIASLVAVYFLAYSWVVQWDIQTGRQRTVHNIFRICIYSSRPSSTILTEWIAPSAPDAMWREVANGPRPFEMVNWSFGRIIRHLNKMSAYITDSDSRKTYATLVLQEVDMVGIGRAESDCYCFQELITNSDTDTLTKADVERQWQLAKARQISANKEAMRPK